MDAYEQTPIVDNGDLDPADRARVKPMPENFSELTDEEQAEALASPQGIPTTTTLSFLICKYGGLIEPTILGSSMTQTSRWIESMTDAMRERPAPYIQTM